MQCIALDRQKTASNLFKVV